MKQMAKDVREPLKKATLVIRLLFCFVVMINLLVVNLKFNRHFPLESYLVDYQLVIILY